MPLAPLCQTALSSRSQQTSSCRLRGLHLVAQRFDIQSVRQTSLPVRLEEQLARDRQRLAILSSSQPGRGALLSQSWHITHPGRVLYAPLVYSGGI